MDKTRTWYEAKMLQTPKNVNRSWKQTYGRGQTVFVTRHGMDDPDTGEPRYIVFCGSHYYGSLTYTESEAKEMIRIERRGKFAKVAPDWVEKNMQWSLQS